MSVTMRALCRIEPRIAALQRTQNMALSPLLDFLKAATGFIRPDPAAVGEGSESEGTSGARYHRRVVVVAGIFGLITALGATVAAVMDPPVKGNKIDVKLMLAAPLVFGVMGLLEGVAIACLFAPQEFLNGPVGKKWMSLIGTRNVLVARLTCAVLALALPGVPAALALYAVWGKR